MLQYALGRGVAFASPGWFRPSEQRPDAGEAGDVLVLSPGPVPTTSIYLESRLGPLRGRIVDTLAADPPPGPPRATELVLVRHAPRPWLRWISQHRAAFGRIALLMDDDMPQALLAAELPPAYALRTARRHRDVRCLLAGCCDELWLSTPELLRRYPGPRSRLLVPLYVSPRVVDETPADTEPVYFYHGTRAHLAEIRWLRPVVEAVQRRCPRAVFEVLGDEGVARVFRGIPRVRVRPWLTWPDYLAYSRTHQYKVGLAPCLDTPFNRARSQVKLFDITRLGAAGVYADLAPYADGVLHGETGLLCAARHEDWVEAIAALLEGPDQASAMAGAARLVCAEQRARHGHWPSAGAHGFA